jgi:hypothetical protein
MLVMLLYTSSRPKMPRTLRRCLRDPIPDIWQAASLLDQAATAHLSGEFLKATHLITSANINAIKEWTESLWGKNSPYVRFEASSLMPIVPENLR